jgi:hypothetical protein
MMYCIEIERGGIGEEDCVLHHDFENKPTRQEVEDWIKTQDIGYDKDYCDFEFYEV